MMTKGIRRSLALTMLAVVGLLFAGCSTAGGTGQGALMSPKKHKVLLVVGGVFTKKAKSRPERLVISDYGKDPQQTIVWHYIHKSTKIKFDEPKIGTVPCDDDEGTCTLKLPTGLLDGYGNTRNLKYTVTGVNDDGKPLDPNDPWVEVDH